MEPRRMRAPLLAGLVLLALVASGCGGDDEGSAPNQTTATLDPAAFSATVDHPLVPLSSVRHLVYDGTERDSETGEAIKTRTELRVLNRTGNVAGVPVAVVDVKEYEDGELVEHTEDYYAQRRDGSVWYLGEKVDDYEEGKIAGHSGQWLTGEGDAKPGLFMPAQPKAGQTFEQEQAPGVAEDQSTVVAVGLRVTTRAGSFADCIKTKDYAPLDKHTEFKFYCPRVGLVRETAAGGRSDLASYR
jgi:hypothetical protein